MRNAIVNAAQFAFGALTVAAVATTPTLAQDKAKRGEYLATIMDCGGCRTPGALTGKPDAARHLGGSEAGFQIPGMGIFNPPNLTPDRETGGAWSEADIIKPVRNKAPELRGPSEEPTAPYLTVQMPK